MHRVKLHSLIRLHVMMLKSLMSEVNFTKVNYKYFVAAVTVNRLPLHTKEQPLNSA